MAISLQVDGVEYKDWVSASALRSLETMSGSFSFESAVLDTNTFPVKAGQECVVFVDGVEVITGFVERIEVAVDAGNHTLIVQGRDKTADVIDSTFGENVSNQSDTSLVKLIEDTLQQVGITGIEVINQVDDLDQIKKGEISQAAIGQTVFSYLEENAKLRQVFLITDGKGNIVISRSNGVMISDSLINSSDNTTSNIISSRVTYDFSNRFYKYIVKSQGNVSGASFFGSTSSSTKNIVERKNEAIDPDMENRKTRTFGMVPDKSYSVDQLGDVAKWISNIRRVRSRSYAATVQGHQRQSGEGIWDINQLVQINDEFCDVKATMLTNTIEYLTDNNTGNKTVIGFVEQDAYTKTAEEPPAQKKSNTIGAGFST